MTNHKLMFDPSFFELLHKIDRDKANNAALMSCPHCGSKLHRAHFMRSGHGLPGELGEEHYRRYSFCCGRDGCRRRYTLDSLRSMRGRAYVSLAFSLLVAIHHGFEKCMELN